MAIIKFQVIYDKPSATYRVGETVCGQVLLVVDQPKQLRGICIKIKGETKVEWTERCPGDDNNHITYHNRETYFNNQIYVFGSPNGKTVLAAGEHRYNFHQVLPPYIPSTFEGVSGQIRYQVEVVLNRRHKIDQRCIAPFIVHSPIDLRTIPNAQLPVNVILEKKFTNLFKSKGSLNITCSLPKRGYVPGEKIPISLVIKNRSGVDIVDIICSLVKTTTFHATAKSKSYSETITASKFTSLEGTSSSLMSIPYLPHYNFTDCTVIDLEYILRLDVIVGMFHRNVTLITPITIGSIPFERSTLNVSQDQLPSYKETMTASGSSKR